MKFIILLFLISQSVTNCFSQDQQFFFTDGSKISLEKDYARDENARFTNRFIEKDIIANITGIGKASPLAPYQGILSKSIVSDWKTATKTQSNSLDNKFNKITTAYNLKQGDGELYISALNSVDYNAQLGDCDGCKVKAKLIILELKSGDKTFVIPVIESLEKLEAGEPNRVNFNDGTSQLVIPFYYKAKKPDAIEITEKEFSALFYYENNASTVFSRATSDEIKKINLQLAKKTHLISFRRKDDKDFVFSSLPLHLKKSERPKQGDKVICKAFLVKIITDGFESNVLIVKSMTKLSTAPARN